MGQECYRHRPKLRPGQTRKESQSPQPSGVLGLNKKGLAAVLCSGQREPISVKPSPRKRVTVVKFTIPSHFWQAYSNARASGGKAKRCTAAPMWSGDSNVRAYGGTAKRP